MSLDSLDNCSAFHCANESGSLVVQSGVNYKMWKLNEHLVKFQLKVSTLLLVQIFLCSIRKM
jgi:hypothetical protein